ncbi:MAG: hypothetical protein ACP5D2_00690 [Candidatus Nanoarchaeia archaeon]
MGEEVLKPYKQLDTLAYYARVAPLLKNFLDKKEIATVIYIPPKIRLLKRATKLSAIYAKDIKASQKFLKFRAKNHLKDAKKLFSKKELTLWQYFFPRKLVEMHYAVNKEKSKQVDRVYIDIDKGKLPAENVQAVVKALIEIIRQDKQFNLNKSFFILWTGNSFHLYILLKKSISYKEFAKLFNLNSKLLKTWAAKAKQKTGVNVEIGHKEKRNKIILDTSQSAPGKLARAPFSLYVSGKVKRKITGVALPVSEKELEDRKLISKLEAMTADKVVSQLDEYKKKV